MKKAVTLFAALAVMGMLAGCGSSSDTADTQADTVQQTASETETEAETTAAETSEEETSEAESAEESESSAEDAGSAEGKTLVVYYSATGNTEEVANYIANATGGELFELEPVEPYTSEDLNWTDENSRVSIEHENPDQRDVELVSTSVDDWDSVSTIYIGYPIWWGIAAWPVDTFVEANDFTGKTVIPFCTSSSSELGESGQLLADLAGTGEWLEGMRFRSGVDEEDVTSWVESLGL